MVDISIATSYGPLVAHIYAGPTSDGATTYANDGKYPSKAHVFGRDQEPSYVGARVGSPEHRNDGAQEFDYLTINGVQYRVDQSLKLGSSGWAIEYGSFGPLTRRGSFITDYASVTDGARKVWREKIVPLIIVALADASQEVTQAEVEARAEYADNLAARIAELRTEADRLEATLHDIR